MKINSEQKHLLYPLKKCKPSTKPDDLAEYDDCADDDTTLIMYKNGGKDLFDIVDDLAGKPFGKDAVLFLEGFKNLFDGLKLIHAANMYHLDIKHENVLGLRIDDCIGAFSCIGIGNIKTSYLLRFIDFGLSKNLSFFTGFKGQDPALLYWDNYFCYPFDLRFLKDDYINGSKEVTDADLFSYYSYLLESKDTFFHMPYWVFDNTPETPNLNHAKEILTLLRSAKGDSRAALIKELLEKADVFALGLMIARSFILLTGQIQTGASTYGLYGADKFADSAELNKNITKPLFSLVTQMTHFNFKERCSLAYASASFKIIIETMRQHFIPVKRNNRGTRKVAPSIISYQNPTHGSKNNLAATSTPKNSFTYKNPFHAAEKR